MQKEPYNANCKVSFELQSFLNLRLIFTLVKNRFWDIKRERVGVRVGPDTGYCVLLYKKG